MVGTRLGRTNDGDGWNGEYGSVVVSGGMGGLPPWTGVGSGSVTDLRRQAELAVIAPVYALLMVALTIALKVWDFGNQFDSNWFQR